MIKRSQYILEIFYCAAFFVYSGSFLVFFWELQSLLLRFSVADIIGFFSYQLAFALVETIIVAGLIIALVRMIPSQRVKDNLAGVGGLLIFSFAMSGLIFKGRTEIMEWLFTILRISKSSAGQIVMFLWLFLSCGLPIASIFAARTEKLMTRINILIENLSVLAALYTGLSIIGILIVIYRNLP